MTGTWTPDEFREHLLPTDPSTVAPDLLAALRSFCEANPEIAAGYLCEVEVERAGVEAERLLRFSVKLRTPGRGPGDAGPVLQQGLIRRPTVLREMGLGFLADRAVPAWEHFGVRVFPIEPASKVPST